MFRILDRYEAQASTLLLFIESVLTALQFAQWNMHLSSTDWLATSIKVNYCTRRSPYKGSRSHLPRLWGNPLRAVFSLISWYPITNDCICKACEIASYNPRIKADYPSNPWQSRCSEGLFALRSRSRSLVKGHFAVNEFTLIPSGTFAKY